MNAKNFFYNVLVVCSRTIHVLDAERIPKNEKKENLNLKYSCNTLHDEVGKISNKVLVSRITPRVDLESLPFYIDYGRVTREF